MNAIEAIQMIQQRTADVTVVLTEDQHGRTIVSKAGTSRVAIISRNGDSFYMVPAVNHGETVVSGGRSFVTISGALTAARRFVTEQASGSGRSI